MPGSMSRSRFCEHNRQSLATLSLARILVVSIILLYSLSAAWALPIALNNDGTTSIQNPRADDALGVRELKFTSKFPFIRKQTLQETIAKGLQESDERQRKEFETTPLQADVHITCDQTCGSLRDAALKRLRHEWLADPNLQKFAKIVISVKKFKQFEAKFFMSMLDTWPAGSYMYDSNL